MTNKFLVLQNGDSSYKFIQLPTANKFAASGMYDVSCTLVNATGDPLNPTGISPGGFATFKFTAASGYALPYTVTVNGASIKSWTRKTGTLIIQNPTTDVTIELAGIISNDIELDQFTLPADATDYMVVKMLEPQSLIITADDVTGRATTTTIHWTMVYNIGDGQTYTITGNDTSAAFPQNTSTTETVTRTISYTMEGLTATTTITQGVWVDRQYTITLNSGLTDYGFEADTTSGLTLDQTVYDGPYQSNNYNVDNSYAVARINTEGCSSITIWINSYAESSWDYAIAGSVDASSYSTDNTTNAYADNGYSTSQSSSSGKYSNTKSFQYNPSQGLSENYWRKITYALDGESHYIYITYRKDSSSYSYNDRGYFVVERSVS